MFEEINAWIVSDRDFSQGLYLYQKYGRSKSLLRVLSGSGPSSKNLDTLIYEFSRLVSVPKQENIDNIMLSRNGSEQPAEKLLTGEQTPNPILNSGQVIERRQNTQEVDALVKEKLMLIKECDNLHATLALVDDHARRVNALRILDIGFILGDMYDRLEHFNLHGVLPPAKAFPSKDLSQSKPFDVFRKIANLKTYISREKRLIRDSRTEAYQIKHKHILTKYQLELSEVERNLPR